MEPTAGAVIDTGSIRKLPGVNLRQDIICVQLKNIRLCKFYNPSIKGGAMTFSPLDLHRPSTRGPWGMLTNIAVTSVIDVRFHF